MPVCREVISEAYLYISKITVAATHTQSVKNAGMFSFTPEGWHRRDHRTVLQILIFKQCMERWLSTSQALAALPGTQALFSVPTWQLTTDCISSPRGALTLSSGLLGN